MSGGRVRRVLRAAERLLPTKEKFDLWWWKRRVRRLGAHSVLNRGHPPSEAPQVDEWQKGILFPVLRRRLRGDERVVLDFGCGPGRFTPHLAELIDGRAIGVDPMQPLLDAAPRRANVEYRLLRDGLIPLEDASVDAVWICLVLMCITDRKALERTVSEIGRVLRDDGLLFLVENTDPREDLRHIAFRSVDEYRALFPEIALQHEEDYVDVGERISILTGRKGSSGTGG